MSSWTRAAAPSLSTERNTRLTLPEATHLPISPRPTPMATASSWTGSVIKSTITVGSGANIAELSKGNVLVAYEVSNRMFDGYDGILGLAYAPLDDAFQMSQDTSQHRYTADEVRSGTRTNLVPYLTQLSDAGVMTDKMSFYTRRSFVHVGGGGANDPLNNGWMIVGGGEESTELYTGSFQTVKVLSDDWSLDQPKGSCRWKLDHPLRHVFKDR